MKTNTFEGKAAANATNQSQNVFYFKTTGQLMKESSIRAGNVTMKQLHRGILLNTKGHQIIFLAQQKGQYMKEFDTLAGKPSCKQHQKVFFLNKVCEGGKYNQTSFINAS